jgi:hypothetical protein
VVGGGGSGKGLDFNSDFFNGGHFWLGCLDVGCYYVSTVCSFLLTSRLLQFFISNLDSKK